jgi:N-acetylmuramic acid 6-phosphate etherase
MRFVSSSNLLEKSVTESRNDASGDIDEKSALEIVTIINNEDKKVPAAVEKILPQIAALVEDAAAAFQRGGRLVYIGAGTSGRLGVLDAAECPPTYGVEPGMVRGIIAGGLPALTQSIEDAEDNEEAGIGDLKQIVFSEKDILVGITASGGAPYVLGALRYARDLGALTAAISCNADSKTFDLVKHRLWVDVGPEVVTGSTRMKSGTAQKLILNMISTAVMIRIGKVYKNYMVDLRPVNQKLIRRSIKIIREITGVPEWDAEAAFYASGKRPKTAIVMILMGIGRDAAERLLEDADGRIARIPGILRAPLESGRGQSGSDG